MIWSKSKQDLEIFAKNINKSRRFVSKPRLSFAKRMTSSRVIQVTFYKNSRISSSTIPIDLNLSLTWILKNSHLKWHKDKIILRWLKILRFMKIRNLINRLQIFMNHDKNNTWLIGLQTLSLILFLFCFNWDFFRIHISERFKSIGIVLELILEFL